MARTCTSRRPSVQPSPARAGVRQQELSDPGGAKPFCDSRRPPTPSPAASPPKRAPPCSPPTGRPRGLECGETAARRRARANTPCALSRRRAGSSQRHGVPLRFCLSCLSLTGRGLQTSLSGRRPLQMSQVHVLIAFISPARYLSTGGTDHALPNMLVGLSFPPGRAGPAHGRNLVSFPVGAASLVCPSPTTEVFCPSSVAGVGMLLQLRHVGQVRQTPPAARRRQPSSRPRRRRSLGTKSAASRACPPSPPPPRRS